MVIPLNSGGVPRREISREKPALTHPGGSSRESFPTTPESAVPSPETGEGIVREAIASKREEIKAEQTGEAPSATARPVQAAASVPLAKAYVSPADLKTLGNLSRPDQVKYLTEIVYQQGLDRAIATVQHLNDPYLLDLLHDTLVDELFQKLKGPRLKNK
jgi:hypothetical protein